ncbi:MAG: hydroxylamine reductase [Candidatus Limimorpha sp.]
MNEKMFCYQCQETAKGTGCTVKGVCGKEARTSAMMDMLLFAIRGLCITTTVLRENKCSIPQKIDNHIIDALFCTVTNTNFDEEAIERKINLSFKYRNEMMVLAKEKGLSIPQIDETTFDCESGDYVSKAEGIGVLRNENPDYRALKELILYGLKGMAAYLEHANRLGFSCPDCNVFIQKTIACITMRNKDLEQLTQLVLKTGEYGIRAMALLDQANTMVYGTPEITEINISAKQRPGILVSGHDLKDIQLLLEQTKGKGIDIYTHGEMLPANTYPMLKKYSHLVGNYGNSWWRQREEFEKFNGPILMTSNCIVPPTPSSSYKKRLFTTNSAGFPGCKHINADSKGNKDFSEIIAIAEKCQPPQPIENGSIYGGFSYRQVVMLSDKIVEAINKGQISRFVVMAGCDGRMKSREYYTEFARALPKDSIILTAGCAKYRYNKLDLGKIGDIPRLLDSGQCNDSYSIIMIARHLMKKLNIRSINNLPVIYNIAWYEQKAIIVLLSLLSIGIKNICIGPTLPAFISPNILDVLIKHFNISTITDVNNDLANMIMTKKQVF